MLLVGLTGGIASGKSLVSRMFRDLGAHIIDADRIVHELFAPGQQVREEVIGHFGEEILREGGCVDRRKLGEIVFNDAGKRAWLNSCLHPKVFEAYHARVKRLAKQEPKAITVFDAALLFETGFHKNMDRTVVVYADEHQQLSRLQERNGLTREQAIVRLKSQMPLDEKSNHADYVINNTGTREETERQAKAVFEQLRREAEKA